MDVKIAKKSKKIKKITDGWGRIYAKFSFNNTLMSLTKINGDSLVQVSSGSVGFKNTKKATPYAAQKCTEAILASALDYGICKIELYTNGIGAGREITVKRILKDDKLSVSSVIDKTPINLGGGCRPRKKPRK